MFWLREVFGWALVALGLYVFYIAILLLLRQGPFILEAPELIAIGFIVFRGGLHVLKVSVAGRVCIEAQKAALKEEHSQRGPNKSAGSRFS